MRVVLALVVLLPLAAGCFGGEEDPPPAPGDRVPPPDPRFRLEKVADGFRSPLQVLAANDGSGRLLVVEQGGRVVAMDRGGARVDEAWLDVSGLVASGGERGLLSVALDPEGRVYASYTDKEGDSVLARYRPGADGRPDPASAEVLLTARQPFPNHNGGLALFGPDGYLYLGLGDGGGAGDTLGNAQDRGTLLGKLLRLDVSGDGPYRAPSDNPFVGTEGRDEIWAFGLRNPWRFSFDRATGDLFLADVGQNAVEEVDFQPADSRGGENYGWNVWEGSRRFRPGSTGTEAVFPVAQYAREGGECSVTGGFVYRGEAVPGLAGAYLFGDYCSGRIRGLWGDGGRWVVETLLDTDLRISSFGEDGDGEVYVVDHGGAVHRVAPP